MRFKPDITLFELDLGSYTKALDEFMQETTKEAARSWLRTVLVIIPTWSRASRATFTKLAEEVGFSVSFGPLRSRKDRTNLGERTSRGGVEKTRTSWHFFYETDLRYLEYNEFNHVTFGTAPNVFRRAGLINPTPYRFLEAGAADFRSFAENVQLPNPYDFLRLKRIS